MYRLGATIIQEEWELRKGQSITLDGSDDQESENGDDLLLVRQC